MPDSSSWIRRSTLASREADSWFCGVDPAQG